MTPCRRQDHALDPVVQRGHHRVGLDVHEDRARFGFRLAQRVPQVGDRRGAQHPDAEAQHTAPLTLFLDPASVAKNPEQSLWARLRSRFALEELNSPLVKDWENWYSSRPDYMSRMIARGERYLFHVVDEVEKRGMPAEIALLPMIESAYNPSAYSRAHASGMWQFIPSTGKLYGLNEGGGAPTGLTPDLLKSKGNTRMPGSGIYTVTVPGAVKGWEMLRARFGTLPLSDLLAPAIDSAENGFPVMEKTAEDWNAEVAKLKKDPAAATNYLVDGRAPRAPRAGEIFRNPNLARTFRTLARGGRVCRQPPRPRRGSSPRGHNRRTRGAGARDSPRGAW